MNAPVERPSSLFAKTGDAAWARAMPAARAVTGVLLVVIGILYINSINGTGVWDILFFDGHVFARTLDQMRAGLSPYAMPHGTDPGLHQLPLVQPPQVVWLLRAVAATPLLRDVFQHVLTIVIIAGLSAGIFAAIRLFLDLRASVVALCVGVFASFLAGGGMVAFVTGNISVVCGGAILWASVPGFQDNRWRWFHVAVFCAALLKPYYVAFWIIPALARGWSWRQIAIGAALAIGAVLVYALEFVLEPELTQAWLTTLNSRQAVADVGTGLYAALFPWIGEAPAMALHLVFAAVLLASAIVSKDRDRPRDAALIIIAIAVNPRMNEYDYCFAAIPAFYIYAARLSTLLPARLSEPLTLGAVLLIAATTCFFAATKFGLGIVAVVALLTGAVIAGLFWPIVAGLLKRAPAPA